VEKREYLELMFTDDDMAMMRRLRSAVDPKHLANRGKMLLPDPPDVRDLPDPVVA
jgi:FAD/FMN-containing dehydrogenase